jgi:hypothetical protein
MECNNNLISLGKSALAARKPKSGGDSIRTSRAEHMVPAPFVKSFSNGLYMMMQRLE